MSILFDVFDVVNLDEIKNQIESPIPFNQAFKLLKRYQDRSGMKVSNWNAISDFNQNHKTFQRYAKLENSLERDLKLILRIKKNKITDPNILITLDVLNAEYFDLSFEDSNLIIKLTPLGLEMLYSNGSLINKIIYQLSQNI
jgi:hypothetical protein